MALIVMFLVFVVIFTVFVNLVSSDSPDAHILLMLLTFPIWVAALLLGIIIEIFEKLFLRRKNETQRK